MWCYIYSPLHGMVRQVGTWWAVHHLSLTHTHAHRRRHIGDTQGTLHTSSCNNPLSSHLRSACSICAEEICFSLKGCVFVCECVWYLPEVLPTGNPVDHSHLSCEKGFLCVRVCVCFITLYFLDLLLFYFPSVSL